MRIAFCDLEGTLIGLGNWGKVVRAFSPEWADKFFSDYDEGKVSYEEGRRQLEKIWKEQGITKDQFISVLKDYSVIDGARELILGLKEKGFKVILITGAISVLVEMVVEDLGIDEYFSAHEFIFSDNKFVEIKEHPEYRRGQGKVNIIKGIIEKEGVDIEDCIAIGGDDINDYWMMKELRSFAVKPHLARIKEVVDYEVDNLIDILDGV